MLVVLVNYILCVSNYIFDVCYTTLTLINHLKIYKTYLLNSFIVQNRSVHNDDRCSRYGSRFNILW